MYHGSKSPEQLWHESIRLRREMRKTIASIGSGYDSLQLEKRPTRLSVIEEKSKALVHRSWARDAVNLGLQDLKPFNLITACPGAGKTMLMGALFFAFAFCKERAQVGKRALGVFVVPTDSLRDQLAAAMKFWFGFNCLKTASPSGGVPGENFDACVMTYAQFRNMAGTLCTWSNLSGGNGRDIILFFDEYHHCGDDKSWGDAAKLVGGVAKYVFAVTGTPINESGMPFVEYSSEGVAVSDYTLSYGEALDQQFCRPIVFEWIDAKIELSDGTSATWSGIQEGDKNECELVRRGLHHNLGTAKRFLERMSDELKAVYARYGDFYQVHNMIPAACTHCMPGTGVNGDGSPQDDSRYMNRIHEMSQRFGFRPVKVAANITESSGIIENFASPTSPLNLINSINKMGEGIDIPRLMVGGCMTNYMTFVWFMQMIGRYIRMQDELPYNQEAKLFLPDVPTLRAFARDVKLAVDGFKATRDEKMKTSSGRESSSRDDSQIISTISSTPIDSGKTVGGEDFHANASKTLILDSITDCAKGALSQNQAKALMDELMAKGLSVIESSSANRPTERKMTYEEEIRFIRNDIERMALHIAKTNPQYRHVNPKTKTITAKNVWAFLNKTQKIPKLIDGKKVNGMDYLEQTRGLEGFQQRLAILRKMDKSGVAQ